MLTGPSAPPRMSLHVPPPPLGTEVPSTGSCCLRRLLFLETPHPCKPPGSFHRAQAHPPDPSLPINSPPRRIPTRG